MIKKSHLCSMHLFRDQFLSVLCQFNGWPLSRLHLSFKSLDETSFCWMYHRQWFNLIDYGYNIALIGLIIQSSVLLISGYLQTKMLQLCLISLDKKTTLVLYKSWCVVHVSHFEIITVVDLNVLTRYRYLTFVNDSFHVSNGIKIVVLKNQF